MKNLKAFLLVISSLLFISSLSAANRYWIATTTANWNSTLNWSTTSGGAGGASVPGSADVAIFNAAKVGSCTINANVNVLGLTIVSGYTGTISKGTFTMTVGTTGYSQAAGTFSGGSGTISAKLFTLSGGTFTSTSGNFTVGTPVGNATIFTHSGGTFNHNNGTVTFDANTSTAVYTVDVITGTLFYNVVANLGTGLGILNSTVQSAGTDTVKAANTFTHSSSTLKGFWRTQGNLIVSSAANGGTGQIIMFGTGNKTYSYSSGRTCNLVINKSSGVVSPVSLTNNLSVQGFKLVAGSFTAPADNFNIGGTLGANATVFDHTAGTYTHNSGTTVFDMNGSFIFTIKTLNTTFLNHVTINSKGTQVLQNATDTLRANNLTLTQGAFNTGIIQVKGNATVTNTFGGTGKIAFMGTVDQNFTLTGATDKFNVTNLIIKQSPGKKVILQSAAILDQSGQSITFTRGNIASTATNLLTIGHGVTVSGMSNSSYVDGPMKKIGNAAFTFPVGKNGHYRKIGISAPAVTTDAYTAEYFEQNSNDTYSHSAKDGSIAELSRNEYWNLARTTGTSNVSVTLSIDSATSCSVDNLSNLKVAAWDGSTWKDKGNGGTSGNVYVGTVGTSGTSSTYGVYALGTSTNFICNPGTSCADVIELGSGDTCLTDINMANKEMWFSFVADSSYFKIEVINPTDSSSGYVNNITLYTGVCTSLSTYLNHELEMDTLYESVFGVYPDSIIENETYYVRLSSNKPIFNFNVCIENLFSSPKEGEENCDNVCPENLINNGDFELGNTGFLSDLTFITTNPPLSPGQYSITTNANNLNNNWVNAPGAIGSGLFMVCDDPIDAVNQNSILWYQIVSNLEANTYYCVSAWVRSLPGRNLITDPDIMLTVANNGTGMFYQVSTGTIQEVDGWVNIRVLVFSGNSTWAEVFLYSIPNGTQSTGNDIGIDDIEFKKVYTPLTDIILEYENEKCMGSLVDFTSGALFDNNDEITWYFGDGTSATQVINPLHIYSQPGQYNVRLKVENCTGEVNLCNIISVTPYVEGEYNDNEPGCCSYYNEYDGTDDIDGSFDITTNTTWTTSRAIKNTLTVKSGNALTIDGASNGIDIEFGPWGKIIVERGAHLIVENARLRGLIDCGTMWQGIEVWGNPAYSSNALFQGKITLGARAMIIDAHNGVLLGKFRFPSCSLTVSGSLNPSPYDLAYSGGIINANNGWFVDNAISIRFAPYNKPNTSVIKHSRFNPTALTGGDAPFNSNGVNDPGYLTGNSYTYQNNYNKNYLQHNANQISSRHIYMWGVRTIPIEDNFFWQSDIGIDAYDSRFKAIDGNGGLDGNEFKEERICIRGAHTVNPVFYNSVISDNNFLGPFENLSPPFFFNYGVQVTGGQGYLIDEANEFNIGELPDHTGIQGGIAISMSGSQGFNILHNEINMFYAGVFVNSSGLGGGLIGTDLSGAGNLFTVNKYGTFTQGKNLSLKIKCNNYLNSAGGLFTNNWFSYGWLANQGQVPQLGDPYPEKRPSGNTFNPYQTATRRDIRSYDHPYHYYHHDPVGGVLDVIPTVSATTPNTLIPAVAYIHNVTGVTKTSTACEPLQFTPDGWDAMVTEGTNKIIGLREKRDSISELIDGGETEELLDAIADTTLNADTLEMMLNEHWPLSDEVLSSFIQIIGRIPYTNYREVILGNEPMAEQQFYELMQAIDTISNEIVYELKYGQGNSDSLTLTKLDWEIQRDGLERQLAFNSLISYYVDDNDSADYALELLELDSIAPWSTGSKQLLFASLLADSNLTAAHDVLNDFEPASEEEEDWKDLSEVMLQLALDSLTVFEMDSVQESLVRELAYYSVNSNAQANAQSILLLVYGEEFNPTIEEPSGKTDEINQPSLASNTSDMLFRFYPNPSTGELNCTYKTDESDVVYLLFFDLSGSKIIEKQLQGGNNTSSFSLSEFGQGVYLYKIIVNNSVNQTGKIVLINK